MSLKEIVARKSEMNVTYWRRTPCGQPFHEKEDSLMTFKYSSNSSSQEHLADHQIHVFMSHFNEHDKKSSPFNKNDKSSQQHQQQQQQQHQQQKNHLRSDCRTKHFNYQLTCLSQEAGKAFRVLRMMEGFAFNKFNCSFDSFISIISCFKLMSHLTEFPVFFGRMQVQFLVTCSKIILAWKFNAQHFFTTFAMLTQQISK